MRQAVSRSAAIKCEPKAIVPSTIAISIFEPMTRVIIPTVEIRTTQDSHEDSHGPSTVSRRFHRDLFQPAALLRGRGE
jgi:hypothetical protein